MPYGYNNRNSYRGSTGYRPSDRRRDRKKKINFRRIRNRAIIIGAGLLILALIFFMLTKFFSCVCGSSNGNGSTLDTSTVRTKETTAPSEDNKTWNFKTANIRDTDKKSKGVSEAGMYVWNQACFEPFYGEADKAKEYAEVMNYAKKTLGKDTNVYSAIIPNHTEMGLPDRLKNTDGGITTSSPSIATSTSTSTQTTTGRVSAATTDTRRLPTRQNRRRSILRIALRTQSKALRAALLSS